MVARTCLAQACCAEHTKWQGKAMQCTAGSLQRPYLRVRGQTTHRMRLWAYCTIDRALTTTRRCSPSLWRCSAARRRLLRETGPTGKQQARYAQRPPDRSITTRLNVHMSFGSYIALTATGRAWSRRDGSTERGIRTGSCRKIHSANATRDAHLLARVVGRRTTWPQTS
jgi:hypothetical protein